MNSKQIINNNNINQAGQALITLLVFVLVIITVASAAVASTIINSQTTSKYDLGEESLLVAQSGIENALLRLTRDSNYSGETLTVGNGTATITVSGTTTKTVTSVSEINGFRRTIQVVGDLTGSIFTLTSWEEVY